MSEMAKAYQPAEVERKWYQRWLDSGCFHADERSAKPAFSIVIPPPNVTGVLHLGHVLNNTIQDILARRARMDGFEVLWLPGTDHAGIATQTVVERTLKKQGVIRHRDDIGRERFVEKVWEWKERHGGIIIEQLKRLGASCDWDRQRFTMDDEYCARVLEVFVDLYRKDLIYRGRRMVNWDPVALTALSDEEVIMRQQTGTLYHFKVEVVEEPGTFLTIATTRPETIPGDTAVAVNPRDDRYRHLVGKHVVRPLPHLIPHEEKLIPIIADEAIEIGFGTGVLKVTPAHDKADFEIGQRHRLPVVDIMNADGTMNELAGESLVGLDRFEARAVAAERLREIGAMVKEEPYQNNVGFSERTEVPVEPRLSEQWFLRYPSAEAARAVVADGRMRFHPERWAKVYDHWMSNIQDWCISRQLWWGHRIPVWQRKTGRASTVGQAGSLPFHHGKLEACPTDDKLEACPEIHVGTEPPSDPENWEQVPDVLDTWFSSWLWPFATMGWTGNRQVDAANETLRKFYPTTVLVTGPDIIFFWVARMIMAGFEYMGAMPFRHVFFTGIVRDKQGRKMSKSLGNSPDPLDLIDKYGADGLRFGLLRIAPTGTDVRFDEKQIEEGRNFANKLWNACRYRLMQGRSGSAPAAIDHIAGFAPYAIDILAKLDAMEREFRTGLESFEFNTATNTLYEFFWANYCDLYLETIKGDTSPNTGLTQDIVLRRFLIALHPLMPHVTEELWHTLEFGGPDELLMTTQLPEAPVLTGVDPARVTEAQERAAVVYGAAAKVRHLKAEYNLAARRDVTLILKPAVDWVAGEGPILALLAGAKSVRVDPAYAPGPGKAATVTEAGEFFLPLEGLIDVAAERTRLKKDLDKVAAEMARDTARLANPNFAGKAPAEVIAEARRRLEEKDDLRRRLEEMMENLG